MGILRVIMESDSKTVINVITGWSQIPNQLKIELIGNLVKRHHKNLVTSILIFSLYIGTEK